MGNVSGGILLIDKEEGESSHSVVRRLKSALKVNKAGHAGTLDPFATGLLVVLLGQGTKLFPYLTEVDKEYRATLSLGVETDTLDPTGRVVGTGDVPDLDPEFIQAKAAELVGEIEQRPPDFSAVRHQGRRAYDLARKGISFELAKRRVRIHRLDVVSVDLPEVTLTVECSKGTYVRSLAAELGRRLGPGAHLSALRRIASGPFRVNEAVSGKDCNSLADDLYHRIIPLRKALPHIQEMEVDEETARKVRKGLPTAQWGAEVLSRAGDLSEGYAKLVEGSRLLAVVKVRLGPTEGDKRFETMRVFA
ncbi:MAG: tRNA pseudouridine(55) synthase TruB [Deltaproteobacteria bacterium]|nr:tRNA pseudouridine(55) synthase TruB [Deltaproteobacteria bacterium]